MKYGTPKGDTPVLHDLVLARLSAEICGNCAVSLCRITRRSNSEWRSVTIAQTALNRCRSAPQKALRLTYMATRLREINPLHLAAAWLREQSTDHEGYQPEDFLEAMRKGSPELRDLFVVTPKWQDVGEISWIKRNKLPSDDKPRECTYVASTVREFHGGDGRIRLNSEMAKRLLDHGECSLDCVTMPIIDCRESSQSTTEEWLQGSNDGRLITIDHLRITRNALLAFAQSLDKPMAATALGEPAVPGVSKAEILNAPWQYPLGFNETKLRRVLEDSPKWISSAKVSKGLPGGPSAMWNPAKLAMQLHDREHFNLGHLTQVINDHFACYLGEWNGYRESYL